MCPILLLLHAMLIGINNARTGKFEATSIALLSCNAIALSFAAVPTSTTPAIKSSTTVGLPSFRKEECHEDVDADLCVGIRYPDGSNDTALMVSLYEDAPTVMKGTLRSNPKTKVDIILKDEDIPEAEVGKILWETKMGEIVLK